MFTIIKVFLMGFSQLFQIIIMPQVGWNIAVGPSVHYPEFFQNALVCISEFIFRSYLPLHAVFVAWPGSKRFKILT